MMREISKARFDALAGYTRSPRLTQLVQEAAWFEIAAERLVGLIVWDRYDHDFGWVILGRDRRNRFRAIAQDASIKTFRDARDAFEQAMRIHAQQPDEEYHQGDEIGAPVDFFAPQAARDRLHSTFVTLCDQPRYSPARELISAMMPFYEDIDGNFVEQFQTTGFDPRIWELYLFAAFTELGYAQEAKGAVPDLLLKGPLGRLAIEATSANRPQVGDIPRPTNDEEVREYLENYVPIKLARALTRKLYHPHRYWNAPGVDGAPFIIALQDFHAPAAMTRIVPLATEYVFGVRHSVVHGERRIERLIEHVYGNAREPSGFFSLPESEHVSAVMLNPLGTILKFNRLGYIAGFGNPEIRMIRTGLARGEADPTNPMPRPFRQEVHAPGYLESWIEGTVVLHNPRARVPLDPEQVPGANHEFLQHDGRIMSLLPDFQPYMSQTKIVMGGNSVEGDGAEIG